MYFIGLTTTTTEKRFQEHKDDPNDNMHKYSGKWVVKTISTVYYYSINKYV